MSMTPREFSANIQQDAEAYLMRMLPPAQARAAGARVAMAFSAAVRAARKPQALMDCSRASIVSCVAMSALTNLMPGGPSPVVYLVPKGGELLWWMTHRGIAALALRAGYQIIAMPVHTMDEMEVEFGEVTAHRPNPDRWPDHLDDLRGCYLTIRRLSDGAHMGRPWMPVAAILKRREKAQTLNVWNDWPIEQAQKTVIKWAMARGYVPVDAVELQMALGADMEVIDVTPEATPEPATKLLPDHEGLHDAPDFDEMKDELAKREKVKAEEAEKKKEEEKPKTDDATGQTIAPRTEGDPSDKMLRVQDCLDLEHSLGERAVNDARLQAGVDASSTVNGRWKDADLISYLAKLQAQIPTGDTDTDNNGTDALMGDPDERQTILEDIYHHEVRIHPQKQDELRDEKGIDYGRKALDAADLPTLQGYLDALRGA